MADTTKYDEYVESEAVKAAKAALEQQAAQKPGGYQSQWQSALNEAMNKILNREKFTYDLNGDALYQQYKDRYIQQGQQAMMDTMGQVATLTGGYNNSYAQTAGQQTYQNYLQGLNDKIPELYQLARENYDSDTAELYNQYGLYSDREDTDYNRYRDQLSDYLTERDYLSGRYDTERSYDYGSYRDTVGDQQWQAEFDEAIKQFLAANPDARSYYESYGKTDSTDSTGSSTGTTGSTIFHGTSSSSSSSSSGTKSISQLAQEVIAGKWGNGTARKEALTKAGYDYSAVQAAVNKLMGSSSTNSRDDETNPTLGVSNENQYNADDLKMVKAAMMTQSEFTRHGGAVTIDGKSQTFSSYKDYVKAVLNKYRLAGLDDATYAYLAAYYGLK